MGSGAQLGLFAATAPAAATKRRGDSREARREAAERGRDAPAAFPDRLGWSGFCRYMREVERMVSRRAWEAVRREAIRRRTIRLATGTGPSCYLDLAARLEDAIGGVSAATRWDGA